MTWDRRWVLAVAVAAVGCTPDDSSSLTLEVCDNGVDDDGNGATDCSDPRCTTASNCLESATCGNGLREGLEFCDGIDLGGATCASQGFLADAGSLGCRADCAGYDTTACIRSDLCGNGSREGGEQCDGPDLAGATCLSRGFAEGSLACDSRCQLDESGCSGVNPCGNGTIDAGELCDGAALHGVTCASVGFRGDGLACNATCDGFDVSACQVDLCGNGRIDAGEVCDGAPERRTCADEGFATGTLGCNSSCNGYDTSACSRCGNNVIDPGETCDGLALGGRSCGNEGFQFGELACNETCDGYDTAACSNCGNGIVDEGEVCDGNPTESCADFGFTSGEVFCRADCTDFITTSCAGFPECGNGVLDGQTGDVLFQEFCEPGVALAVEPALLGRTAIFPTYNALAQGCLIYDSSPPFTDTAPIMCNADCTIDISNCEGLTTGDFCEVLGLYGDGFCDPCDRISGIPDPDCLHPTSAPSRCGDGVADGELISRNKLGNNVTDPASPFDWCDGDDLRGLTCADIGFAGGVLACRRDCNFDTRGCVPTECGDGVVQGREACEPGQACADFNPSYTSGTINCLNDCLTADESGCL